MFAALLRLFDHPTNHTHECNMGWLASNKAGSHLPALRAGQHAGWLLPTAFERLWPTIWGCSEPLAERDEASCASYRNHSQRCLVQDEASCHGCREWHSPFAPDAT